MGEKFEVVGEGVFDSETDQIHINPWVDITDVVPTAVKVEASEIKIGDCLFDAFGGTHEIVDIKQRKGSKWRTTIRSDGYEDIWASTDLVTIQRCAEEDRP